MQRALVWPALECAALDDFLIPQALKSGGRRDNPRYRTGSLPYPASGASWASAVGGEGTPAATAAPRRPCLWFDYMYEACLAMGAGVLPTEFDFLLQSHGARLRPSSSNTLGAKEGRGGVGPGFSADGMLLEEVRQVGERYARQPLLYLSRFVEVTDADRLFARFQSRHAIMNMTLHRCLATT